MEITGPKELLLLCCRSCWSSEARRRVESLALDESECDAVCKIAYEQDVLLLVFRSLGNRVSARWRALAELQAARNLNLQVQLLRIHRLFTENKIRFVPYKGPALALTAYSDGGLRHYDDLDILVSPFDVPRAVELLVADGYQPDLAEPELNVFLKFAYEYSLKKKSACSYLELHWKFLPQRLPVELTFEKVWESRQSLNFFDRQLEVLGPEMEIIVLAVHGCKHCWCSLLWISDIAALLERQAFCWKSLLRLSEEVGAKRCLENAALLAQRFYAVELPIDLTRAVSNRVRILVEFQFRRLFPPRRWGWNFEEKITQFLLRDRWSESCGYLLHMLVYPTITDLTFVNISARFWWAYFLIRPFSYPIQLIGRFTGPVASRSPATECALHSSSQDLKDP